jgi:hypothetical protein
MTLLYAQVQYQQKELCREACRDTQTSTRLASYLVRAPNFRFEGHEFESSVRQELGALAKVERSGLSTRDYIRS